MPRKARVGSGTGMSHVMMRGIITRIFFEAPEDYYQFIATLDMMCFRYECGVKNASSFLQLNEEVKRDVQRELKERGASHRQLERLIEIGRGVIQKLFMMGCHW